jgi:hypothetical protein
VISLGIPAAVIIGAVTGWSSKAIGVPSWLSWTIAVPVTAAGMLAAWSCTSFGRDSTTSILLKAYRRDGIEVAHRQYCSRISPERAGLQWLNVAIAIEREGDGDAVIAVCRHAAECGFPPAMAKLAYLLDQRGEKAEAWLFYRRAVEAGYHYPTPTGT